MSYRNCQPVVDLDFDYLARATTLPTEVAVASMVVTTERDDMTWFKCERCGLMFDDRDDARQHEENCDAEEPSYIQ